MIFKSRFIVVLIFFSVAAFNAHAAVVKGKTCAAIQNVINQLPKHGGEVIVPAGIYNCKSPIIIERNNISVRGTGTGTVLRLANGVNAPVIIMGQAMGVPDTKTSNISVSNLIIDGNRRNQTSECMGGPCSEEFPLRNNGISIRHCFDCRVERVTVHGAASGGLVTELKSRRLTIRDYRSFDNEFDGLAGYETEDSIFSGIHLYDNLAAGFSFDIQFNRNMFNDVVIENSGSVGIFMRDSKDNIFTNMHINNSKQHGVFLAQVDQETDKPAAGQTFTGLMVSGSGGYGVLVNDPSCVDTVLVGAQLINNQAGCIGDASGLVANVGSVCR